LPIEMALLDRCLRNTGIYSYDDYRTRGGKEQIVSTYLRSQIHHAQYPDVARKIFGKLSDIIATPLTPGSVPPAGRAMLTVAELSEALGETHPRVEKVLESYVSQGFIRKLSATEAGLASYELAHAYLANAFRKVLVSRKTLTANSLVQHSLEFKSRIPLWQLLLLVWWNADWGLLGVRGRKVFFRSLALGLATWLYVLAGIILAAAFVNTSFFYHFRVANPDKNVVLAYGSSPLSWLTWRRGIAVDTGFREDRDFPKGDASALLDQSFFRFRRHNHHDRWGWELSQALNPAQGAELAYYLGDKKLAIKRLGDGIPRGC
jgi:hypothetical protein